jgi:hypothetical protein
MAVFEALQQSGSRNILLEMKRLFSSVTVSTGNPASNRFCAIGVQFALHFGAASAGRKRGGFWDFSLFPDCERCAAARGPARVDPQRREFHQPLAMDWRSRFQVPGRPVWPATLYPCDNR